MSLKKYNALMKSSKAGNSCLPAAAGSVACAGADSTLDTLLTFGAFSLGCLRPLQAPPQCRSKHTAGPAKAQPFLHLALHRKEENSP